MKKTLYLIDGPAIFYRAHFAFIRNPLISSKGEHTSAIFGFTNTIWNLIKDEKPDYIAVAFDTAAPTFRHEQYPAYKANRAAMPDELIAQLPYIDRVVEGFNIPSLRVEGYEADDLMGTLAVKGAAAGLQVYLVTSDKDMAQLVNDHIKMYVPGKRGEGAKVLDVCGVMEKYGVKPSQIVDYLALLGDSSDNVPGVPGVGAKTAVKLLAEYGDLETILQNAANIKNKRVRTGLMENKEQAYLSQKLVTIETNAPVELDLPHLQLGNWNIDRLIELFTHLDFRHLRRELIDRHTNWLEQKPVSMPQTSTGELQLDFGTSPTTKTNYRTIDTEAGVRQLIDQLQTVTEFALDTETTSEDPMKADLVGLSISIQPHTGVYIPVAHVEGQNVPVTFVLNQLRPLLADPTKLKIFQNFKYDWIVLHRAGIESIQNIWDTMIAAFLIDPGSEHGMDFLAQHYLHHTTIKIKELIGTGKKQILFSEVPIAEATPYAAEDADITLRLKHELAPKIESLNLKTVFEQIEIPLTYTLARIEMNGIKVDTSLLSKISVELEAQLSELESEIYALAGEEFNINSTQQLRAILFDKLGMPVKTKTAKGVPSTNAAVLEELATEYELPQRILEYREFAKLKSTYVDALPNYIHPVTGRIHTSLIQTGAATGRLASRDPNLQNIPIRSARGKEVRSAFVATDDQHVLLSADYSQIELRVMAHLSGDPKLINAFQMDRDIHTHTASLVFNVPEDQVDADMRRQAKIVNFGVMYGMGQRRLARDMGIPQQRAKEFIENYFATYAGIKTYIEQAVREARVCGYAKTLSGRRRLIHFNPKNRRDDTFAENMAINTPIQGSAADIIKLAMLHIQQYLDEQQLQTKMVLQVHDELLFDVPLHELDQVQPQIKELMESAMKLRVPLKVEIGTGKNWLEAH